MTAEDLRIISDELWGCVQNRLAWLKQTFSQGRPAGLLSRGAGSRYLLSGFLVCSECGAKLTIICGHGKRGWPRYGCARNFYRGTCSNNLRERQDRLERRLLAGIQRAVLQPEAVDYALAAFEEELGRQMQAMSGQADEFRQRKARLETEIENYTRSLADGYSPSITAAIAAREKELGHITACMVSGERGSIQASIAELRQFVHSRLADVRKLLYADVPRARMELARHVDKIVLRPVENSGERFYVASGEWSLLGKELGPHEATPPVLELVAGACNGLTTPTCAFEIPLAA